MVPKSILLNAKEKPLPANRLECSVCKQRFWMTSKYLDHMSTHKHLLLSCNICNKGFYSQKLLDGHYVTHDEVTNTYDCEKCSRKFLQKYQLEQHIQFHFLPLAYEPEEPQKKKVRFNNILESKDISDDNFSNDSEDDIDSVEHVDDSDEDNSDSFEDDSDSFEEEKEVNKITTTRSGRIVKAKKIFENEEPEVKRRNRKSLETGGKASVDSKNVSPHKFSAMVCGDKFSENFLTKQLYVVAEKIPDQVYKKYIEKGNVYTEISENNSLDSIKSDLEKIKLPEQSTSKIEHTANSQIVSPTFPNNFNKTNLSKFLNERHNKYLSHGSVTYLEKAHHLLPIQGGKSTDGKLDVIIKPTIPSPERTFKTSPVKSQIDKQFLYIGPKQDLEKIKTIIEEMKTVQDDEPLTVPISSNNMQPVVSEKILPCNASLNFENSNQNVARSTNSDNSVSKRSVSVDACTEIANITNLPISENNLMAKDGILGKKVIKDFLVVKVTPELMQEMHRKSLESQSRYNIEEPVLLRETARNLNCQDILQSSKERIKMKCQNTLQISNLNKNSKLAENKKDNVGKEADIFKTNVSVSKQSKISTSNTSTSTSDSDTIEIHKDDCAKSINKRLKKDNNLCSKEQSAPIDSNEHVKLSKRVIELYKAKLAEKERKKKKKYELKKQMRHMEKLLNKKQSSIKASSMYNSDKAKVVSSDDICKVKKQSNKILEQNKIGVHVEGKVSSQLLNQKTSKFQNKGNSDKTKIVNSDDIKKTKKRPKILKQNKIDVEIEGKVNSQLPSQKALKCQNNSNSGKSITVSSDDDIDKVRKLPKILERNKIGVLIEGKVNSQLPDQMTSNCQNKSKKCMKEGKLSAESYSDLSLVTGETFTIGKCNFIRDGPVHDANHIHSTYLNIDSQANCNSVFKDSSSSTENAEKEAVKRAHEISLKFEKTASEAECLAYLNELDNLFTSFNIGKKCPFIFSILRYCRLHVKSYDVKERAASLHGKIIKSMKSSSIK